MTDRDDLERAWAGLLRSCEPPCPPVVELAERRGAVAAWEAIVTRQAPRSVLVATAARLGQLAPAALRDQVHRDLEVARSVGARVIGPGDESWPDDALVEFQLAAERRVRGSAPPLALYVRGDLRPRLPHFAVTMVGSRACSSYGQRIAGEMAYTLARHGALVVSGAAFGIDTAAHRSALRAGSTVAVLACGIDRAYPEANRALLDAIAAGGAVLSEYPPGTTPARHRFLVRNRLLAALGAGTVVVEAGRRSGTLSTAAAADQLGRVVMAVPGPVTSAASVGCHLLLAERFAHLVTSADDVLAALGSSPFGGPVAGREREEPTAGADPRHPTDGLDAETARVYDALPGRGVRTVRDLVTESGLIGGRVLAALAVLEVHGLARRDGASWRRLVPG